jgi:hypothetical protein
MNLRYAPVIPTLAFVFAAHAATVRAQAPRTEASPSDEQFVVEYYYKVKWGYQDEFIELYRRNHFPLLQKRIDKGTMTSVTAVAPRYHGSEDGRWDYRVTIVFPSVAAAHLPTSVSDADKRALYPDSVKYAKEEQRRFEILLAHWDLPLVPVSLKR